MGTLVAAVVLVALHWTFARLAIDLRHRRVGREGTPCRPGTGRADRARGAAHRRPFGARPAGGAAAGRTHRRPGGGGSRLSRTQRPHQRSASPPQRELSGGARAWGASSTTSGASSPRSEGRGAARLRRPGLARFSERPFTGRWLSPRPSERTPPGRPPRPPTSGASSPAAAMRSGWRERRSARGRRGPRAPVPTDCPGDPDRLARFGGTSIAAPPREDVEALARTAGDRSSALWLRPSALVGAVGQPLTHLSGPLPDLRAQILTR